jgi:hypothetical protein
MRGAADAHRRRDEEDDRVEQIRLELPVRVGLGRACGSSDGCARRRRRSERPQGFMFGAVDSRSTGTGNWNKGTGNWNKGTGNWNKGTGNRNKGTGNRNKGTGNWKKGTGNRNKGTGN